MQSQKSFFSIEHDRTINTEHLKGTNLIATKKTLPNAFIKFVSSDVFSQWILLKLIAIQVLRKISS